MASINIPIQVNIDLREEIQSSPEMAWIFHCSLVRLARSAKGEYLLAHKYAAEFMHNIFNVDTSQFEQYKELVEDYKAGIENVVEDKPEP